jgi:hypothetical protein
VRNLDVAHVGLDILSLLTPTFDAGAGSLTVRGGPYAAGGAKLPLLLMFPGVAFLPAPGKSPVTLHSPAGQALLHDRKWTLDVTSGAIVLER